MSEIDVGEKALAVRRCSVELCENTNIAAKGMCRKHYRQDLAARSPRCSVDGCDNQSIARKMCTSHYWYLTQYGSEHEPKRNFSNPEESFKARTVWKGKCLIWVGYLSEAGYGRMIVNGQKMLAHRYAWERSKGKLKPEVILDHICHNRACVNVSHLRIVTQNQNMSHRRGPSKNSKTGIRNVSPHSGGGWQVTIQKDHVLHHFGTYHDLEEAAQVAQQARESLFGKYAGRG